MPDYTMTQEEINSVARAMSYAADDICRVLHRHQMNTIGLNADVQNPAAAVETILQLQRMSDRIQRSTSADINRLFPTPNR